MRYSELIQLYFDRSNALQWYWTLYVVIVGGLLAFSSLRERKDALTGLLVSVLFACFAYKNCGAIGDVTAERHAILSAIKGYVITPTGGSNDDGAAEAMRLRDALQPTLDPPAWEGVRNFHITSDLLTLAALWAIEWRRRKGQGAPPKAA
jgi:hypothetical protein